MIIQVDVVEAIRLLERDKYHNYNTGYSLGRNEIIDKYINNLKSLLDEQNYSKYLF